MTQIGLSLITFDAGTQIRAALDQQVVSDYADAMTDGAEFPPIVLFHDGNQHYLADGFHRFMAAQRLSLSAIAADVRPGTKADALWFALGANKANGKRLSEADKKHAIEMAIATWPERSMNHIAEQLGCSRKWAQDVREQVATTRLLPSRVEGRDGKTYPAKRGPQVDQRVEIEALLRDGHRTREIAETLGVSPNTVGEVRESLGGLDMSRAAIEKRRARVREMAGDGYSSRQMATEIGVTEDNVRAIARRFGIDVPADRAIGKSKRHDSNRIVAQIVADAENLIECVNLVVFADLDRAQLAEWRGSLQASRDKLGSFIRRLMKEQQHGEAA